MDIKLSGNVIIRHQSVPECQWCDKAKEYFEEKGMKYTVIISTLLNLYIPKLLIVSIVYSYLLRKI